ncbi:MAG: hypothetical protein V9G08_03970 [Dermatophilaceae bacterium]
MTRRTHRPIALLLSPVAALVPLALSGPSAAGASAFVADDHRITVADGQTWVVDHTTRLQSLRIAPTGQVVAPAGFGLTLTVDGVETGQRITQTGGSVTALRPGTYRGDLVLTVAVANPVPWQNLVFPFRQAVYVGPSGVDESRSVLAAVRGGQVGATSATNLRVSSTGEAFDGVYVKDAAYRLVGPRIELTGNGRSDFVGYGAAVVGTGPATRLVVDGARISTSGAVRTGVVADDGSNVVVKNSTIQARNGTLPGDYQSTVDLAVMQDAPWMLSISGNNRATNLLGAYTKASYVSSSISSEGWGVLSSDVGHDGQLTAIASRVANTGGDGYGSYAIGNVTERFLGTTFDVATYATINRGGAVSYGDSTREAVAALNTSLDLRLTPAELASIPVRATVVDSQRFGVMWHGAGTVDVSGGTQFLTREATFLDKGQAVGITVDGSRGARLTPANGILMQVMTDDDPGPQFVDGKLLNSGVYHEPTSPPVKATGFDTTAASAQDAAATFTDIALTGDFFNAYQGGPVDPNGPPFPPPPAEGKNMTLTFVRSNITGVITASTARHALSTITSAEYRQLGEVTNTPSPVVNNGVIVDLRAGSAWTVTGTSHLSSLTVAPGATLSGAGGRAVSMTVDGTATTIVPGTTYTGAVVLTVG